MGLFDKKYCDICGAKIGLLGNRKLEDGNLCKNCAAKLSPWFSDRRQSTVAEIGEQLSYREANREKVSAVPEEKSQRSRSICPSDRPVPPEEADKLVREKFSILNRALFIPTTVT